MLTPPGHPPTNRWFLILVAGLVGWTVLVLGIDSGHFGMFQDDGLYLTAARSLCAGQGYGLLSRPGEPPPKYPIGLPAVLALVLQLDPRPPSLAHAIELARALTIVAGWAFFLVTYSWLRRVRVAPGLACLIVLTTAWQYVVMIQIAVTLMADLPFAAVAFGLFSRTSQQGQKPRSWRWHATNGVLAGFGFLLRSNGVTLIAASLAAVLVAGWPRRGGGGRRFAVPRSALIAWGIGVGLLVIPATWYAGRHPRVVPSNSYLVELQAGWSSPAAGLRIVAQNLHAIFLELPSRIIASPTCQLAAAERAMLAHPVVGGLIQAGFSLVIGLGLIQWVRRARLRDLPVWVHAAGTVAIFLVWPWPAILDRFFLTLIPLILLAFVRGLAVLLRSIPAVRADQAAPPRLVRVVLVFVWVINAAVSCQAARTYHRQGGQWNDFPSRADLARTFRLIQEQTEVDAVVASAWPEMIYLHTGRTAVPLFEDEAVLLNRFGDVSRLQLWRQVAGTRPFYLLLRSRAENQNRADEIQAATLTAPGSGLTTQLVAETPSGHYRVCRLVTTRLPRSNLQASNAR